MPATFYSMFFLIAAGAIPGAPLAAQIQSAPEFQSGSVFQKNRNAAAVDGTSHVSAEESQMHTELRDRLRRLAGHGEGVGLLDANLLPAAEKWFRARQLPLGVAVTNFLSGKAEEGVAQLMALAQQTGEGLRVLPFLAETAPSAPGRAKEALAIVGKIAGAHPDSAEAAYCWGRLLRRLAGSESAEQQAASEKQAIAMLRRSAELDRKSTQALLELSRLHTASDDRPAAIAVLEEVIRRDGSNAVAHFRLASLYRAAGQPEKARQHLVEFQKLQSK